MGVTVRMSNCSLSSLLLLSLVALLQAAVWDLELCKTRESHWTLHDDHHDDDDHHEGHDHGYIYSGQSEENPGLRDWGSQGMVPSQVHGPRQPRDGGGVEGGQGDNGGD